MIGRCAYRGSVGWEYLVASNGREKSITRADLESGDGVREGSYVPLRAASSVVCREELHPVLPHFTKPLQRDTITAALRVESPNFRISQRVPNYISPCIRPLLSQTSLLFP